MNSKLSKNKKYLLGILLPVLAYIMFQQTQQTYYPKTYPIPTDQKNSIALTQEDNTEPAQEMQQNDEALNNQLSNNPTPVVIYITGAVKKPGVVELNSNQRLKDAIEIVGGFTENADISSINLAEYVKDEQHYIVAKIGETPAIVANVSNSNNSSSNKTSSRININTATKEELKTLDGIGDGLSQRIIDFREQNGAFSSIESIQNVSGIGEKKYERIKDSITVQ